MRFNKIKMVVFALLSICFLAADAQPFSTIDLKDLKPEQYKRKIFRSEKTTTDELNKLSLFLQNTYSYYNFLFNANTQMELLLQEAKKNNKDDFSQLLSFYPYDVNTLSKNKYLDTVVEKATTGILMHDLRSKWVDELYFVLGNAYFFQQKYDSAQAVYQYINFAFSPRDDGYFVPIGSNVSDEENVFSMVTKENNQSFLNRFKSKPKRNDAFLWQIRNLIDSGEVVQANSFIQMLRSDAHFPTRLQMHLEEIQAYYYYRLRNWDSSALYLSKTIDLEPNNALKARKYFLTAQLYQHTDSLQLAEKYFLAAINQTINPELEVHAELNNIALAEKKSEEKEKLESLTKKEKFYIYRDLIYYNQAKSLLASGEINEAKIAAEKSIQYNVNNPQQRSKSFALLANIHYLNKNFQQASADFDSIATSNNFSKQDSAWFSNLKSPMKSIKTQFDIIDRNDSILRIAVLPEKEQLAFLDKEAKRIRRLAARQENANAVINMGNISTAGNQPVLDIFASNTSSGEWYFNDQNAVQNGYTEFLRRYGNRKNEDNWIRSSRQKTPTTSTQNAIDSLETSVFVSEKIDSVYVTAEELLMRIPKSETQKKVYKDSVATSLFEIGKTFQNDVLNFDASTQYFREFLFTSPQSSLVPEALYHLFVSSYLNRNDRLADSAKNALLQNYGSSQWAKIIGNHHQTTVSSSSIQNDTTKIYDAIYQQFLEGKFEEAIAAKATADNLFGTNYWTPQLLYIEALYHVTQKKDSLALLSLNVIKQRFAKSLMVEKANVLINVLNKRSEIENYLATLQIQPYRPEKEPVIAKTNFRKPPPQPEENELWKDLPKEVIIVLDKEGNAVPKFPESLEEKIKRSAEIAKNTGISPEETPSEEKEKIAIDTTISEKEKTDSLANAQTKNPFEQPTISPKTEEKKEQFNYEKMVPTYTMIVLDNVDKVYLNEVGNAFNRYNLIMFDGIKIDVQSKTIGERYTVILLGPFKDHREANGYISEVANATETTIIPWLEKSKYLFRTINKADVDKIMTDNDLEKFILNQH